MVAIAPRTVGNLPGELSSFVGRSRELARLRRLLSESRLVTLTGIGGTGKTRLALRVATEVRGTFPDGVWFVDLTELRQPGLSHRVPDVEMLAYLMMSALGLREQPGQGQPSRQLADLLADRRTMVVWDNCEHLQPECAALALLLLGRCPRLRLLITSRGPLAVTGEVLVPVAPLAVPDPHHCPSLTDLPRYEAVALFVTRMQEVRPDFHLTADNRVAVAELCHRLDGLPLAIELAAARCRVLAPQQILNRLVDRFALLIGRSHAEPMRQQTLRACMEWSYELCTKPERMLWARMAVFVGGCERDAVEGVCVDELLPAEDVSHLVTGLVDKSILIQDQTQDGAVARYRMLDTTRYYGREQLVDGDEEEQLLRRHRDWYQQLVAHAQAEWISNRQAHWYARLDRERPNLRAAMEYCLAEPRETEAALELAVRLPALYWWSGGLLGEGRRWLDRALAQVTTPTVLRARALLLASSLAGWQGDIDAGTRLSAEGDAVARQLDAVGELTHAAFFKGTGAIYRGDPSAAIEMFEDGLTALSDTPEPDLELRLNLLLSLGFAAMVADHPERADACSREVLAITEPLGEVLYRSHAMSALGLAAWRQGRPQEAADLLDESLRVKRSHRLTDRCGTAVCLEGLAWTAAHAQQHRRAATLLGAADSLWTSLTFRHHLANHDICQKQAREALGDTLFADALQAGRDLPFDEAVTYALDERYQPATPALTDPVPQLTPRERQIAELVGQGLSNKQVASKLFVSQRTAESHVRHIMTKWGFTSRSEIAAWIAAPPANPAPS